MPIKQPFSLFTLKVSENFFYLGICHYLWNKFLFSEAHPTEAGDYINYFLPVNEHKTIEDRFAAASKCLIFIFKKKVTFFISDELLKLEKLPGPFLVDNMKNEASKAYGSFPDRLYIVLNNKIVYQVE